MNKKEKIIVNIIIFTGVIIDQITKFIALNRGVNIEKTENNISYILMSIIIIMMIFRYISRNNSFIKLNTRIVLSFAITGALGNLIDRMLHGYVVVFIKCGNIFNLNLSYIYIIFAWIGLAIILSKNSMQILKTRNKKNT